LLNLETIDFKLKKLGLLAYSLDITLYSSFKPLNLLSFFISSSTLKGIKLSLCSVDKLSKYFLALDFIKPCLAIFFILFSARSSI